MVSTAHSVLLIHHHTRIHEKEVYSHLAAASADLRSLKFFSKEMSDKL